MKLLKHIPSWIKSKYFISGFAFLVWMLFFDKNDFFSQYDRLKLSKEIKKIDQKKTRDIADTRIELDLLKTNAQTIEKYAREKYMMKKDNEDLFILNSPTEIR